MATKRRLVIKSYAELLKYEKDILKRIAAVPNGGNLFLIHPFRLLEDVGVHLSEAVKKEILELEPRLSGLSDVPYQALKATQTRQSFQIRLKGLFRRRSA